MKILKSYKRLVLSALVVLPLLIGSCDLFEERDRSFDMEPQIEFKPLTATTSEGAGTLFVEDEITGQDVLPAVQLIGPQRDSALPVSFTVAGSSTAIAGTHYNLVTSSPVSLPANSSSVGITIEILDNNVDDADDGPVTLVLELQDSDGVEAAENLKTLTIFINLEDETP